MPGRAMIGLDNPSLKMLKYSNNESRKTGINEHNKGHTKINLKRFNRNIILMAFLNSSILFNE